MCLNVFFWFSVFEAVEIRLFEIGLFIQGLGAGVIAVRLGGFQLAQGLAQRAGAIVKGDRKMVVAANHARVGLEGICAADFADN